MKKLYFCIKSFFFVLKTQKFVSLILLVVLSIASASLIYLYSYNRHLLNASTEYSYENRTYNIYFENVNSEKIEQFVTRICRDLGIDNILEISVVGSGVAGAAENEMINTFIIAFYPKLQEYRFYPEAGDTNFTSGEKEAILSSHLLDKINVSDEDVFGGSIQINKVPYKIIGYGTLFRKSRNPPEIIIPYQYFYKTVSNISNINIILKNIPGITEQNKILQIAEDEIGRHDIALPKPYSDSSHREYISKLVVTIALIFFSAVNIFGLFRYITLKRKSEFNTYRLCGALKKNIVFAFAKCQ
jgi:hypothetical protein